MLCEKCKKNQATVYVKNTINGAVSEYHLCSECAGGAFSEMKGEFSMMDFMSKSGYFTNVFPDIEFVMPQKSELCSLCGSSIQDILQNGKVGCAVCYDVFYHELLSSIRRIHGNVSHMGKIPQNINPEAERKRKLENLKKRLRQLVIEENFEEAARVRDEIKELSGQEGVK